MSKPFTVKAFCDWWIGTVLLVGGPQCLEVAYRTAAEIASDEKLHAIEHAQAARPAEVVG